MSKLEKISWKALKTNPFQTHLHPSMFSPTGLVLRKQVKLKGGKSHEPPTDCLVMYDRSYARAKIINAFKPLIDLGFPTEAIIHEVRDAIESVEITVASS
jgi:hypothetical protein